MSQTRSIHRRSPRTRRWLAVAATLTVTGAGIAAVPLFAGASTTASSTASAGTRTLTVAADGSGQYRTVQAAVDAAAAGDTISIAKGTYHEVVTVPASRTGLTLTGATGRAADVVITFGNASGTARPGGSTYGTLGSATATFAADGMTVRNLTIINSFSRAANPGIKNTQAVALAAEGDRQVYVGDRILGHQDTLLAWSPNATAQTRQYFRDDYVSGDVDFLFGNATAVFDHDTLQALDDGARTGGVNGMLTAANTEASKKYGFLITGSTVVSTAKAATYWLGRPWHPTATAVAQVVVRDTVLPAAVKSAAPWTDMSGFAWKSARFDSYADTGAGAAVNADSPQLGAAQAVGFTAQSYLAGTDGWNPTTTAATTGTTAGTTATGDARQVSEPKLPTTVCATVPATLAMPNRVASAAAESTPPDTSRIQRALDACAQTGSATVAVRLGAADASHTAFLTGPLTVHRGEVLLLDPTVTLFGSRNPANYQVSGKPTCGTLASSEGGCAPLISVAGADAGIEAVRAANGTQGRIDGRGDQTVLGRGATWWGLATAAQKAGENQQDPRLIQAVNSDNFTLYHVDLLNSPNFHVVYQGGTGFTAWGVRIRTPATARNTDGIDPAGATNVTIADSFVMDGDDGVAIKGGSASRNITVENSHFYGTHGISIGSETNGGVTNVLFRNNTLTGTDAFGNVSGSSTGIRIKSSRSNGGRVSDVTYLATCVTAVRAPMVFDTHYSNGSGSLTPWFTGITVDGFRATASPSGARSTFVGLDASHPLGLALLNVSLDTTASTASYAALTAYDDNLKPSGTDVSVAAVGGGGSLPGCSFPAFPAL
ncbi:pectinesterase family protein [Streptacidiphilus jiangxiensis]|uniref:Pectin methylesterase n=1 Tax=Streptacidiphilus jiangxiensis TaxID=235985 RepID=A0A1H7SBJ3_STRJI|nr:pectinesterase family protein [Streptacidiphilus jiangxiensis]SEL69114.1 Pectin methylesterase [Streptacidiphilus jiangxiensis]